MKKQALHDGDLKINSRVRSIVANYQRKRQQKQVILDCGDGKATESDNLTPINCTCLF